MTTLVQLSDPHFGTVNERVRVALVEDLHRHPFDLLVVTGDVSQRARRRQLAEAGAFFESLAPRSRLVVPGNHDLPLFDLVTRFTDAYRYFRRYVSAELEPFCCNPTVAVLGVNSTRVARHKNGVVSDEQMREYADRIAGLTQPFKLVALHHPMVVTLPEDESNRVRGAEQALERWISAGADLFLGGHIHLPYCVTATTAAGRSALVLQAGTAVSTRCRAGAPNSYNRVIFELDGDARRMRIERRDYDRISRGFYLREAHEAVATEAGWSLKDGT